MHSKMVVDNYSKMVDNYSNPAYYEFSEHQLTRVNPANYPDLFDRTIYDSDEFRMYGFKIKKCPRTRSHDWTQCPFAHRGEKAKRRDPRRFNYAAIPCPDFRDGDCIRGETCHYAHGVFEYWLHPDKYRTRVCNAGEYCRRKVCFFAHSPDELRDDPAFRQTLMYPTHFGSGLTGFFDIGASSSSQPPPHKPIRPIQPPTYPEVTTDFLASLSGLRITENREMPNHSRIMGWFPGAGSKSEDPNVEWVSELLDTWVRW